MSLECIEVLDLYSDGGGVDDAARLAECLDAVERREFYPKGLGFVTAKDESIVYVMPLAGGRMRAYCPMSPTVDKGILENVLAVGQRFAHWTDIAGLSCHVHEGVAYACAESSIPPRDAPYGTEVVEELLEHARVMSLTVMHDLAGLYKGESLMQVIETRWRKHEEFVDFMLSRLEDDDEQDDE